MFYFQALKDIDGAETLARNWPTTLSYMSGSPRNLETELLIGIDNVAHAIQKALNVTTSGGLTESKLSIDSYQIDTEATNHFSLDSDDNMPDMGTPEPLYNRIMHYKLHPAEEEHRK